MTKLIRETALILLFCGLISLKPAMGADRPAEKILAEIKAVEMPPIPKDRNDRAAIQQYVLQRQKAADQKAELIGELLKSYPDSPELPPLVLERWQGILMPGGKTEALNAEINAVLATSKNDKLIAEAAFIRSFVEFRKAGQDADVSTLMPIAESFIKRAPKDPRGAMFLGAIASKATGTPKADELKKRIEKDYPDSPTVKQIAAEAKQAEAEKRVKESIGKPFELEFTEAFKGSQISMASLKGKVVIIDFWATWCGPCVGEMPKMKELYAKYKDQGVEFIGVSLDSPKDQGGYDSLKEFVEKNKIEWPQFYKADGSASEFARNWAVKAIPTVFAISADGNLFTMEARGNLETLIPELLETAKKSQAKP